MGALRIRPRQWPCPRGNKLLRKILPTTLLLALLVPVLVSAGCARGFDPTRVPKTKIFVSNFEIPPGIEETPLAVRGWWFGSENIRQNPRSGAILSERLNQHLALLDYVSVYAPLDLKRRYLGPKKQMLEEAYPDLSDEEINDLLSQVPPIDFARELRADKMITGQIRESYLQQNRTFDWWKSRAQVDVQLVDVLTGEIEWAKTYEESDLFASTLTVQEKIVERIVEDLQREYFRPIALASGS